MSRTYTLGIPVDEVWQNDMGIDNASGNIAWYTRIKVHYDNMTGTKTTVARKNVNVSFQFKTVNIDDRSGYTFRIVPLPYTTSTLPTNYSYTSYSPLLYTDYINTEMKTCSWSGNGTPTADSMQVHFIVAVATGSTVISQTLIKFTLPDIPSAAKMSISKFSASLRRDGKLLTYSVSGTSPNSQPRFCVYPTSALSTYGASSGAYSEIITPRYTGSSTSGSYQGTKSYDSRNFSSGETYTIRAYCYSELESSYTGGTYKEVTCTVPAMVSYITITRPYVTTVMTDGVQLVYTLHSESGSTDFEVPDVTFTSSDTSIATISDTGLITPLSIGTVTFTVTSQDDLADYPSASVTIYIGDGTFPFETEKESTDYLTSDYITRITRANTLVYNYQTSLGVSIPDYTTLTNFSEYATALSHVEEVMTTTNNNIIAICEALSISYSSSALTFSDSNINSCWYDMVDEWLRLMPIFRTYAGIDE